MCAQLNLSHTLVAGTPENINDVQDNFQDIVDHVNNALIGDDNLTSPNNSVPRVVFRAGGVSIDSSETAQTYLLASNQLAQNGTAAAAVACIWHPVSADLAVSGKTTQIRVCADLLVNTIAPACSFTVGLYPVSAVAGGGAVLTLTLGTIVASVVFTTPSASTSNRLESSWVTLPAAGSYVLTVAPSGAPAATSVSSLSAWAEIRHS